MSSFSGPQIPTSGLVLDLDANNSKSYFYQQNLAQYSQDWTQYIQASANVTITIANTAAPDGTITGQRITTTVSGYNNDALIQKLSNTLSTANTNLLTFSTYVKQGTSPRISLNLAPYNGTQYKDVIVNLTWANLALSITGSISGRNYAGITPAANGWYRLWCTTDNIFNATGFAYRIYNRDQYNTNVAGEYNYIWGSQVEYGNTPSPYIVTTSSQILANTTWTDMSPSKYNFVVWNNYSYPTYPSFFEVANNTFTISAANTSTQGQGFTVPVNSLPNMETNTFSIEAWIKHNTFNSNSNYYNIIALRENYVTSGFRFGVATPNGLSTDTTGCPVFWTNQSGGNFNTTTPSYPVSLNTWYQVVVTYDGYICSVYVNGVLINSVTGAIYIPAAGRSMWIGGNGSGTLSMNGQIASFKWYNRPLSPEEINNSFNAYRGRYGL
jgi:hypothetical protein